MDEKPTRKPISKKLRFEVFKRDSFTCQYCGKMSPDVILEVDHVNPVASRGDNNIINLITCCFDCNRGKGKRELSDSSQLKKQQSQLKELSERRNQLELLVKWKQEMSKIEDSQTDVINDMISNLCNYSLSDFGKNNIKKLIKKYGISLVMDSTKESFQQYYKEASADDTSSLAINKIPSICYVKSKELQNPLLKDMYYLRKIIENRGMMYDKGRITIALQSVCKNVDSLDELISFAKVCKNYTQLKEYIDDEYGVRI